MNPDQDEARIASERENLEHGFHGEEEDASTPQKDLVAAIIVGVFAVAVMVLASQQPNPGRVLTAPGLLPFITGLTLLAMAVGLAVAALRDGGGKDLRRAFFADPTQSDSHAGRGWALLGLLVALVVLIDVLPFEFAFRVGSVKAEFGSFEGISIPILAAILRLFWRASVLRCVLAAAITVLLFASAFRYGFNIPLPGSG
ncbi:MAG: tripartite tricarboxylate transporter TctB family protein [Betaproteobacteria bacterium]|nr:tripartite tricarboxylate transporter TctB family protein [Betaproteobacteria bacterium]